MSKQTFNHSTKRTNWIGLLVMRIFRTNSKTKSLLSTIVAMLALPPASLAGEVDWSSQIAGLESVTVTCANANREKYAARICADMRKRVVETFSDAGIAIADLGDYPVKEAARPANPARVTRPLSVTIYVRATHTDGVHAINLRNHISVFYEAATEQGDNNPRKGELVMWEGSTTGSGPRDQLAAAIVGASYQKLETQLEEITRAWPK